MKKNDQCHLIKSKVNLTFGFRINSELFRIGIGVLSSVCYTKQKSMKKQRVIRQRSSSFTDHNREKGQQNFEKKKSTVLKISGPIQAMSYENGGGKLSNIITWVRMRFQHMTCSGNNEPREAHTLGRKHDWRMAGKSDMACVSF